MQHVESSDGTSIAFARSGSGPPLVIVMGAFGDRTTSAALATVLAPRYTVYEYDRRARGNSGGGDGVPSSVEAELGDLVAVVAVTGEPPFVYGHSSGGALALEAAARGVPMRRLAVYEPPYTGRAHPGLEFGERLDELVAAGRRDEAAERWLLTTGIPATIVDSIKRGPDWAHRCALAHTLSADLRVTGNGEVPVERLRCIDVPVLAMAGGETPGWAATAIAALAQALPRARTEIVEGQQHIPADAAVAVILERFFS